MHRLLALLVCACCLAASNLPAASQAQETPIEIPFEKFSLPNGLRVIVHEDRKAPIVAVSVWYHVGSKDEPPGKTGFAHLFEHLMFNGSENSDTDYISALEELGATGLNGTTGFDRTNYYQTIPKEALERVLWMESDRMGHLLGAIDQAKLDEQRGVVLNEKRQGENAPYGQVFEHLAKGLFTSDHPYHHLPIGSTEDINAASLDDVRSWFETYYRPSNAVLVLAGDIDAEEARPLVEHYFSGLETGPETPRIRAWPSSKQAFVRETIFDDVPQARLYRAWATAPRASQDSLLLQLGAQVFGSGKNSVLYRTLVHERRLATDTSSFYVGTELASIFALHATVVDGADPAEIDSVFDEALAEYLRRGPSARDLDRVKTQIRAGLVRGLERVGGGGGKAVTLAQGEIFAGDPGFIETQLRWLDEAEPRDVRDALRRWISGPAYQLEVAPEGDHAVGAEIDRSTPPTVADAAEFAFPEFERATLANGADLVFVRRDAVPVVEIGVQFDAGYASDREDALGAAAFAMAMLNEGAGERDKFELEDALDRLGATLSAGSNLDVSTVRMSALTRNLAPSLDLLADVILRPQFAPAEIELKKTLALARIAQEQADPVSIALRLLPPALYGDGHAYGIPLTGSGTPETVAAMQRDDLLAFHRDWLRPDNARFFVVGDTTLEEVSTLLNEAFSGWAAPDSPRPTKLVGAAERAGSPRLIVIDRPDAPQSLILADIFCRRRTIRELHSGRCE